MVIPTFVRQALEERPITVYGTGQQSRSFLHIDDALNAITMLMDAPEAVGDVFNVGNEQEITINELAERVRDRLGFKCALGGLDSPRHVLGDEFSTADFRVLRGKCSDIG